MQTVDVLPRSNVKQTALDSTVDYGGPAASAAGVAAGLGADARLLTAVGTGPMEGAVAAYLARAGVHTVDLAPDAERPFGISTVLVEEGTGLRAVLSTNARAVLLDLALGVRQVAWADAVLVDGHRMELCLAVAEAARAAGVPVVFDGGSWKPGTDELVRRVDVAVVSADFRVPSGTLAELMRDAGVTAFGQSLGERPWELEVAGERHVVPVVEVPEAEVVDTVGAGDVLHGALAYGVARWGLGRVVAAARFASAAASASCRAVGARRWLADPGLVAGLPQVDDA